MRPELVDPRRLLEWRGARHDAALARDRPRRLRPGTGLLARAAAHHLEGTALRIAAYHDRDWQRLPWRGQSEQRYDIRPAGA
jgi:hypothetical protein